MIILMFFFMLFAVLRIFYNEQLLLFFFLRKKCLNVSMHSKVAVSMKADPLTPPQVNYFMNRPHSTLKTS